MIACQHLTLAVTNRCNMQCFGCYVVQSTGDFPFELYESYIIAPLLQLGGRSIGLTGGEPLLHKDILKFIRSAKEAQLVTSLVTNGLCLDSAFASQLSRAGLDRIQLSLDSPFADENDRMRAAGSFDAVCRAIPVAKAVGIVTSLVAVPNRSLQNGLDEYIKLAVELGADNIYFRRHIGKVHFMDSNENEHFLQKVHCLAKRYRSLVNIYCGDPLYTPISQAMICQENNNLFSGCSAGITSIAVQSDGSIIPCTRMPIKVGHICRDGLQEIWGKSRVLHCLRLRELDGKCGACQYRFLCGGCRAAAYLSNGNYLGSDPICTVCEEVTT